LEIEAIDTLGRQRDTDRMVETTVKTDEPSSVRNDLALENCFLTFLGRLGGFTRREAQGLIRQYGGTPVEPTDSRLNLVVIGADERALNSDELLDESLLDQATLGELEVIDETQLLERLGLIDERPHVQQHYTPSMLAELLGVPTATIRRWHRQGLIMPVREVHRLPYFDFQEVITARRLAQLLAAGASPAKIEAKLRQLARLFPDVDRPLAQLSVIVEGRDILLRDGEGLLDAGGQRRFDFAATDPLPGGGQMRRGGGDPRTDDDQATPVADTLSLLQLPAGGLSIDSLMEQAADLEAEGHLADAINTYRSILFSGPRSADIHFLLAELLYRTGDITAARERYYSALEIDEDFVEARANLGCVLAETGQSDLAIAAFEGALARHSEYPDVLFHLARTLDDVGRLDEAIDCWRNFLSLTPDSPWASEARDRLGLKT
jgi:tetratricopeptide (TPR) repeat protein